MQHGVPWITAWPRCHSRGAVGRVHPRPGAKTGMAWSTLARMARTGEVERVAHGVYRWSGVPHHELEPLRAAWLQLAPRVPAWQRVPSQGVVSHRSAASAFGIGELPADVHDFTVAGRRQTRRPDVRLHVGALATGDVVRVGGFW